jgi:CSLREA domain-containing protein
VAITPATATIGAAGSAALVANVAGGVDSSVTWQSTGGNVVGTGRSVTWQAPIAAGTYTIRAISVLDPSRRDSARVTVTPVTITLTPPSSALFRGQPVTLAATVTGTAPGRDSVAWSGTCGTGTPSGANSGTITLAAPTAPGPCTVVATSRLDATRSASATLVVRADWLANTLADSSDGACTWSHCTLREALLAANASNDVDTIRLDLSTPAAIAGSRPRTGSMSSQRLTGTITLTSALPIISTPMAIIGPGSAQLTIDANASTGAQRRVLDVNGAVAVSISGLTLRGGVADEAAGLRVNGNATVSATDLTIRNNHALVTGGGGIRIRGGSTLTLTNSLVTENQSDNAGVASAGGIGVVQAGTLIMRGGSVTNNRATVGSGGGLGAESGVLRLENVTVSGNQCGQGGGGIVAWAGSTLEVTGGAVRDNSAAASVGGGILLGANFSGTSERTTATIAGTLIQDNVAVVQGGGIQVTRNAQVTMSDLRIVGNRLTATQSVVNSGILGAGINIGSTVTATLTRSLVSGNTMATVGGGGTTDGGGGIAVSAFVAATNLTIVQSTIAGNTTGNNGGGLFVFNFGAVTMQNSTISGNSAANGGGILARRPVTLTSSTIAANTATVGGGGLLLNTGGSVTATNVLLAGNQSNGSPSNCTSTGGAPFSSGGSNLGDDATCAWMVQAGDRANTVAGLQGTLADNGGPTPTHALLAGSAAINGGLTSSCAATDQRGAPRVGVCDIGAFEFGGTPPANAALRSISRTADVRTIQPRRSVAAPTATPVAIDWMAIDRAARPIRP